MIKLIWNNEELAYCRRKGSEETLISQIQAVVDGYAVYCNGEKFCEISDDSALIKRNFNALCVRRYWD